MAHGKTFMKKPGPKEGTRAFMCKRERERGVVCVCAVCALMCIVCAFLCAVCVHICAQCVCICLFVEYVYMSVYCVSACPGRVCMGECLCALSMYALLFAVCLSVQCICVHICVLCVFICKLCCMHICVLCVCMHICLCTVCLLIYNVWEN